MKAPVFLQSLGSLALLFLLLLAAGCGPNGGTSEGVQLILSTQEPTPGTTFELRFDEAMAGNERIGAAAEASPLVFEPELAGRFVWTSGRSGVFTPSEPLALDTAYRLSLRPGLLEAGGQASQARLRHSFRTPAFGVASCQGPEASTNAFSQPEFHLWYNEDVKAAAVAPRAGFVNAEGRWIPAHAQQGTEETHYSRWYRQGPARTWKSLFAEARSPDGRTERRALRAASGPNDEIANLVIVTPSQPLGVGRGWRLVIGPKVPAADGRLQSREEFEALIGDVRDFTLEDVSMQHVIDREPELHLEFSKAVPRALTNSFTNWVQISPWPIGLRANVYGGTLFLTGGWERDRSYVVSVRRGLPAEEAFGLGAPCTFTNDVPPVAPRLYLPEFSTDQLATGNRSFPLLVVNVPRVWVRAKLLAPQTAIHALRGYDSYTPEHPRWRWRGEEFHRLDYNLVPGRTVFQEELVCSNQPDVSEEIKLDWDRLLKGRKTGIVFLEAERVAGGHEPPLGTQALIQLTDLGVAWKSGGSRVQAFVFSYTTGQAVTNARVRLMSDENEALQEAGTDASGLATLTPNTNAAWLAVESGDDLHALRIKDNRVPSWQFDLPTRWHEADEREARQVALFTDRDVYRPNESVNLKLIARDVTENGLSIPAGITGALVCLDAQNKEFFQTNLTLSALGSWGASIAMPSGPRGQYRLEARLAGQTYEKWIQLADYQPAAFEIQAQPKAAYGAGERIRLPVGARYLFGKPLSRAQVHWSLTANDQALEPEGFREFSFQRAWQESRWNRRPGSFTSSGEVRLEGGTNCVLRPEVPLNAEAPQARAVSLLLELTDLNQQTLTRSVEFVQHSSKFYLGLRRSEEVLEPGKALPVEVAAVGADGNPWREPVSAHLKLSRVEWQTTPVEGAGRTVRYHSECTLSNLVEKDVRVAPPVKLETGEKGFRGSPIEGLVAPEGGEYLLEITARDSDGRETAASVDFNVADQTRLAWDYRNDVQLKLVADKELYQPGDTALLLVKEPFSGAAWVTVERETVLRSFLVQLEGNAPAVRVPLQAGDGPNVFVSVTLVRGAAASTHRVHEPEYRVGYCELRIEDPATRLRVEVAAGAADCQPGEAMSVEARVRDPNGRAVPDAEVTLYAVDEGVLSLTEYPVPDLHAIFLAPRALGVASFTSLPCLMPEDPERRSFANKGYLGGGGGLERLRHHFLACPLWRDNLITDAEGKVSARFTVPDSVTRYRLIAVAHTARNQFGSGKSSFNVSKPLLLEPALPQFANVTDRVQARAIVLNQTDEPGEVLATLQVDDKVQGGPATLSQSVRIAAHGSAVVEFPVTFTATGTASWIWRARFAGGSALNSQLATRNRSFADSVQSSLPVGNVTPLLREVALVRLDAGETNLSRTINPQLLTGTGTLNVTVANTRLVALREAMEQLLHYPYGCVEQTGSSLLPWVVLRETPALLAFTRRGQAEADTAAKAGIARLFTMQTSSGGLSYWPGGSQPMLWGSAYGAFVLAQARKAGLPVPEREFDALLNYLTRELRTSSGNEWDPNGQCLALYALALAGRPQPAYDTRFYELRARLGAEERALVALALATGEGGATLSLREPAVRKVSYAPGSENSNGAMIRELVQPAGHPLSALSPQLPFGCAARENAIRLLAWLGCPGGEREAERAFRQLQTDQKRGHWNTTQGNAWALLAMREYLRRTETGTDARSGVLARGNETKEFQLETGCGVFSDSFAFTPSTGDQPIILSSPSGKPLYVQITVESRLPAAAPLSQDRGFSLHRTYERLNDDNEPVAFERLTVGDRVLVTLRLAAPEPARYTAIDDPLPGVLEAVNTEFKTQQLAPKAQQPNWQAQADGGYWWSDFHEIRAERVLFFRDYLPAGKYLIRYVARVRAGGSVTAPAAKVEGMYEPERFGLTETQLISSEATE